MNPQENSTPLAVRMRRERELAAMRSALRRTNRADQGIWDTVCDRLAADLQAPIAALKLPEAPLVVTGGRDVLARFGAMAAVADQG